MGVSFITAFTRFMNSIIKDEGLIYCDPTDKDFKNILVPVFEKELTSYPASCETAIETSAVIEQNYEPQAKPRPINIFYTHNSNRYLIEPRHDDVFALKGSRHKFNKSDLFDTLYSSPERFSGNVMLRPICQDYLLPTVAYIGGPSEIAYYAQFKGVYEFFNIKMPVIYPRTSVTLLENRIKNFLTKYNLKFEELFNTKNVSEKLLNQMGNVNIDGLFVRYVDELNALGYNFEKELEKIDKGQANSFKNKNERFTESIEQLKEKFIDSQINQNKASTEKLRSVIGNIYPSDTLQERLINILYFLNKYSLELIGYLKDNLEIDNFTHQILDLNVDPS
jgi:bacillithiol biosynthesis cysteine-adding enzyme BshC